MNTYLSLECDIEYFEEILDGVKNSGNNINILFGEYGYGVNYIYLSSESISDANCFLLYMNLKYCKYMKYFYETPPEQSNIRFFFEIPQK